MKLNDVIRYFGDEREAEQRAPVEAGAVGRGHPFHRRRIRRQRCRPVVGRVAALLRPSAPDRVGIRRRSAGVGRVEVGDVGERMRERPAIE